MIKLSVVLYNSEAPQQTVSAIFGASGGTLGRSVDNHMVLHDPKRHLSRRQAFVASDGRRHTIVNLSLTNPLVVNGRELEAHREIEFAAGDQIVAGLFVLQAETIMPQVDDGAVPPATLVAADPSPLPAMGATHAGSADSDATSIIPNVSSPGVDYGMVDLLAGLDAGGGAPDLPCIVGDVIPESVALSSTRQAPPLEPSAHAARAPGLVIDFDDLLGGPSHGAVLTAPGKLLIPDNFDPFDLPSLAVRNSDDPLAAMDHDDVTLESFEHRVLGSLVSSAADTPIASMLQVEADAGIVDPLKLFSSAPILPPREPAPRVGPAMPNHVAELDAPFLMPGTRTVPQDFGIADRLHRPAAAGAPPTIPADWIAPDGAGTSTAPIPAPDLVSSAPVPDDQTGTGLQSSPVGEPQRHDGSLPHDHRLPPALQSAMPADIPRNPRMQSDERDALLQAFIEGANIPAGTITTALTPELMRNIGQILASATQGTVELIASRALVKREVKADVTMIVVNHNNPLKFLPDGQTALMQMFGRKVPGFMEPVEAMHDAYQDLRAHQVGVVAGMRAALDEVLQRFDPGRLDQRIRQHSVLDSLLPIYRKASMWDHYHDLYQQIQAEAQDDFQALFGKAFLAVYEEEIDRFKQERCE